MMRKPDGSCTLSLYENTFPEPPAKNASWADWLRWVLFMLDPDDSRLPQVACLFAEAWSQKGLTASQAGLAQHFIDAVYADYVEERLLCQNVRWTDYYNEEEVIH